MGLRKTGPAAIFAAKRLSGRAPALIPMPDFRPKKKSKQENCLPSSLALSFQGNPARIAPLSGAKNTPKDRVDMLGMIAKIEFLFDFGGCQRGCHLGVGQ